MFVRSLPGLLGGVGRPIRLCANEGDPSLFACRTGRPVPTVDRFGGAYDPSTGADERFWFGVLWYRPAVGTGRKVGVVGRETGVAIELAVLVVAFVLMLLLPSDVRDCGLRMPVGILLCELGGRLSVGD